MRVPAEIAQQFGGASVARLRRERGGVGTELAKRLDDGPGLEQVRGQLVGQEVGLTAGRGDVPGVHGGVEGAGVHGGVEGAGRRGDLRGQLTLRERCGCRYITELERALSDDRDCWTVYADCLTRVLHGGSQALAQRLAGTFAPTPELSELAQRAGMLAATVHQQAQRDGALREDVSPADVVLLLETLSAVAMPAADGGRALRRRYLALLLQALRAPGAGPLPGPAADPAWLMARWLGDTAMRD
ncbi:MAG TPA: hypothetical protein VG268_19940 [Streptosporangiaceae bacterium]|nr:hypothetical protein [Streptosporangiaceae bacterium]